MGSYYENLVKALGEDKARQHMREVALKRTKYGQGGGFRDKELARQAQLKSAEARKQNNADSDKRPDTSQEESA